MKGMRKISRGSGFVGVLNYAAEGRNKELGHGRLIGGNMAGFDQHQLAKEFRAIAALRPDIEKPVWHSSLRMPAGEDVADEKWQSIALDYMRGMQWDLNRTQYCVWKHTEEHVHIIANRVLLNGTVYLGQNENLKSTRVIAELEKSHCLTITKGPDLNSTGELVMPVYRMPKRNELERSKRTGASPAREVLQRLVTDAIQNTQTVQEFMLYLEREEVNVMPNISGTGHMNGLGFGWEGMHFAASKLGARFKWSKLKQTLNYSPEVDNDFLHKWKSAQDGHSQMADHTPKLYVFGTTPSAFVQPITGYRMEQLPIGVIYTNEGGRAFVDSGERLEMIGNPESHIDALMMLAGGKWGVLKVEGDFNFKKLSVLSAARQ
jgi:hypothetical protein